MLSSKREAQAILSCHTIGEQALGAVGREEVNNLGSWVSGTDSTHPSIYKPVTNSHKNIQHAQRRSYIHFSALAFKKATKFTFWKYFSCDVLHFFQVEKSLPIVTSISFQKPWGPQKNKREGYTRVPWCHLNVFPKETILVLWGS